MDNYNKILTQLYTNSDLDDCIRKVIPTNHREDFKQELFLILLEKPSGEIIRISESGKLLYYVVRIILNLSRQERNVFHTKYMDKRIEYNTAKVNYSRSPADFNTMELARQFELANEYEQSVEFFKKEITQAEEISAYAYKKSLLEKVLQFNINEKLLISLKYELFFRHIFNLKTTFL